MAPGRPEALALSRNVPLLIGNTEEETAWWLWQNPYLLKPPASDSDLIATLTRAFLLVGR